MKYFSKSVTIGDKKFSSKREAARYGELVALEKDGKIDTLTLQPKFTLLDNLRYKNRTIRGVSYVADFLYFDKGRKIYVVEEVKGFKTDLYMLKMKLFLFERMDNKDLVFEKYDLGGKYYGEVFDFVELK